MTSGGGKGIQNLLNTTATTTNLTMNVKDKMQIMTSSMLQEEGQGDDSSWRFVNFCELHLMRCNCVQLLYLLGSYKGSLLSLTAHILAWQLCIGDVLDLLWLACMGVTDAGGILGIVHHGGQDDLILSAKLIRIVPETSSF